MARVDSRPLGDIGTSAWDWTAAQVRDQAASLNPTPGGGSVSIITGTLGVALIHKGASISFNKSKGDPDRQENLAVLCSRISSSIALLSSLADADSCAYRSYLDARSLPRANEAEETVRQASMEAELLRATQVPLDSAMEMCRALELAEAAVTLSDKHLLSDVFAGALLIRASIQAVLLNVDANLPGISDAGARKVLKEKRVELESVSLACGESIDRTYQARVSASKDFKSVR